MVAAPAFLRCCAGAWAHAWAGPLAKVVLYVDGGVFQAPGGFALGSACPGGWARYSLCLGQCCMVGMAAVVGREVGAGFVADDSADRRNSAQGLSAWCGGCPCS